MTNPSHKPVLYDAVFDVLQPKKGERVLDVTLGLGGHASGFLKAIGSTGTLIGLDADERNLADAEEELQPYASQTTFHHCNFSELASLDLEPVDIIFADLGLSSPHLDDADRGFTFRHDAPLDMRFDQTRGQTVSDIITYDAESDIADILFKYGEIRQSKRLATEIKKSIPLTTFELKDCIKKVCGFRTKSVLPQVFQAFRIAVNKELEALEKLLAVSQTLLKVGGRMGIISFHSLEDRMVKQKFKALSTAEKDPNTGADIAEPSFKLLTKKAVMPDDDEVQQNSRSRSAKFRAIERHSSFVS